MIEISTEKGIVRLDTWDDLVSRPGFVEKLDPNTAELKDIIGRYLLRDGVYCGLTNCGTPHQRGFLVVTTDGRETNIGKDCGRREFGVDFDVLSRKINQSLDEQIAREDLHAFRAKIPDLQTRISRLNDGPSSAKHLLTWAHRLQFDNNLPNLVRVTVREMANSQTRVLTKQRPPNEREQAAFSSSDPDDNGMVTEEIGSLDGVEFLYSDNFELRSRLDYISNILKNLSELDIDSSTTKELKGWRKEVEGLEPELAQFERRVEQGRRLFRKSNILQLIELIKGKPGRRKLREFCDELPD